MFNVQPIGPYSAPTWANAVPHTREIQEDVDEDPGLWEP